jgi:hypothetical protein
MSSALLSALGVTGLRKNDIHPNASLGTVVRAMSCRRCSPRPPFCMTARSDAAILVWAHMAARTLQAATSQARRSAEIFLLLESPSVCDVCAAAVAK